MTKNKNLRKNFLWNTIGSTLYAFTSLIFLIAVTRINGLEDAGVFTFAFSNACVFVIIGTFAGRIFQVTEKEGRVTENDFFYNRLLSIGVMALLGAVFGVLKGYDGYKFAVVFVLILFKALEAMAEFYYGVIQKKDEIHCVGKSLTAKAILSVSVFIGVDIATKNILLASIAMTLAMLLVMALYDIRISRKLGFKRGKLNLDACLAIFKSGCLVFVINILTQYLINAPKYAIDDLASSDQQTLYGIIAMPATFMVLVSNFMVHPVINQIKSYIEKKNRVGLNKLVAKLNLIVIAVGALGSIAGYFLAVPIFKLIYGVDVSGYEWSLVLILIGASFYGIVFIIENVLIALRETIGQAVAFVIAAVSAFLLTRALVAGEAISGGAKAYIIVMSLLLVLYGVLYYSALEKRISGGRKK